jgi:beta-N-acetylhexosaminidase
MDTFTSEMSLPELIGNVLVAGFHTPPPSPEIIDLIQRHHVSNIILFKRNIQSAEQVHELTHNLQMIARAAGHRHPLLIMIDQENGMLRRFGESATTFPGNMALGAIGSTEIAYEIALATGRELKALGITMNLAPVLDVNNNPANPVIGVRSFGEDPYAVGQLGAAMVKGYQAASVINNLKHFPGHGDTAVDSHLALPVIPYTLERLETIELVPFKEAIKAGADSVMIAHMYLPALIPEEMEPASVSRVVITGLLREKLGFSGLIISDCLEMQAIVDTVGIARGSVMGLQAGLDLLLISHRYDRQLEGIAAVRTAVQDGTLASDTLRQAAERVLQFKARTLSWDDLPDASTLSTIGCNAHLRLRDHAYELSTTLVRNTEALLPLRLQADQRLLLLLLQPTSFTQAIDEDLPGHTLLTSIQARHPLVDSLIITAQPDQTEYATILQAVNAAAVTLVVTVNANLDPYQGELVQRLLQSGQPIVGIAAYNPYDLLAFPALSTYLVTYEYTQPAFEAATRVIFGEIPARGKLPVSIPGSML